MKSQQEKRRARHKRIRAKIFGTAGNPRLSVFRSGKHIYAQLIDDEKNKTIFTISDLRIKKGRPVEEAKVSSPSFTNTRMTKTDKAKEIGRLIAEKAKDLKIEKIVFDRGGYKYHGRIKSVAEGAREGGLIF